MNELVSMRPKIAILHLWLLSTVSLVAILGCATASVDAEVSDDNNHPNVWIELGGQLERQTGQGDVLAEPFISRNESSPVFGPNSPLSAETPPRYGNGGEGSITFLPNASDWVFSAAIRYGRSVGKRNLQQLTDPKLVHIILPPTLYGTARRTHDRLQKVNDFSTTKASQSQSHTLLDFQVGKDVGLGMLGGQSSSIVSFGVRYAQFSSRSTTGIRGIPKVDRFNAFSSYRAQQGYYYPAQNYHSYGAYGQSIRTFHGIGPSVSWVGSASVIAVSDTSSIGFDWGVNAAVLFGRQRANGNHQTKGYYVPYGGWRRQTYSAGATFGRSRQVIVPNVGGFVGGSFRFPNARLSLGYRGDFFLGVMDTGIDARASKTVGFYGPFAGISIGFGG